MVKKWLNKKVIAGSMAVGLLALAGCSNSSSSETVASVDGEKITKDDLYEVLVQASGPDAVEALIDEKIVELEIKKADIKVSDEEVQKEIDNFKENAGGEEAFKAALEQGGITEKDFEEDIIQYLSIRKLMEPLVEVTDKDVKAYFEENKETYDIPEQVDARHILVEDEKLANDLHKQLKDGADFAELAQEHSTDGSAAMGGDLGFFTRGEMVPEFEDKAFSMKVGDISEPVKSDFGYHLIEVLDKTDAAEAKLADHKEEIKEKLIEEKMQTEYVTWLDEKREEYDVKNELFGKDDVEEEEVTEEDEE